MNLPAGAALALCVCVTTLGALAQEIASIDQVKAARLRGELSSAQAMAQRALATGTLDATGEVMMRLELASIHDRFGLHENTRPVAGALAQVDSAALANVIGDPRLDAAIELARSEFEYRAEMAEREFLRATVHAERARELFAALGDGHGEAEAVHRLGLIRLQQGRLNDARELFDRSLALDRSAGERPFFRGEYERHVAFVELFSGDTEAAIPHFRRSLDARRRAGAIDASLFAANSLASALVDIGRAEEAQPYLDYAMTVARQVSSPVGRARNSLVLGRIHEATGNHAAARAAFESALRVADSIGLSSVARQARSALAAFREPPP